MYIQSVRQYSYNTSFGNAKTLPLDEAAKNQIFNILRDYEHGGRLSTMLKEKPEMLNQILKDTKDMSKAGIKSFVEGLARETEAYFSCFLLPHP